MVHNDPRDLAFGGFHLVISFPCEEKTPINKEPTHKDIVTGLMHRAFYPKNGQTLAAVCSSDIIRNCQS